ncbi:MAG: acyl-CoA/acyl-ACP dehydrogenase [Proteobacteria bacterium]|nr:acyl-CoA/acyl-ACP dehydrogenase [Pseudomonadota bacterium]
MDTVAANSELDMLREGARGALKRTIDKADLRGGAAADAAYVARAWTMAAEMGWLGLLVPPSSGGLGLGLTEAAVLTHELGRALFPAPFTETAIVTATLLAALPASSERREALAAVASGRMRVSIARFDSAARTALVQFPQAATHFLALTPPVQAGGGAMEAHLMRAGTEECWVRMREPLDVTCPIGAFELSLNATSEPLGGTITAPLAERLAAVGHIAGSAELVGVAEAAFDMAVAYVKERHQFGAAVGSFQAIKHKLVDAFILLENAKAATAHAAAAYDSGGSQSRLAIDAARGSAAEAALRTTADCIQVHGALGFSWEHDAHLFLKRARRLVAFLGDAAASRRAIGDRLALAACGDGYDLFAETDATIDA